MVIIGLIFIALFFLMASTSISIYTDRSRIAKVIVGLLNILVYIICVCIIAILIMKLLIYK